MDSPVSGGVAAAKAGTLAFMCGGDAMTFEKARVVLSAMGRNIFHAGPAGAGQVAKGCNNMLLAIHMIGTCEALEMGARNGLDPKVLSEIMLASSGRNWSLEVYNPYPGVMDGVPASNDYKPGFMVDLMVKDLGLAMDIAGQAGVDNQMGQLARKLYEAHQAGGNGPRDFSSILERLKD
jgi:3-hydroxyisobutyrate dehydrogenase